jgi:hypothetical protein
MLGRLADPRLTGLTTGQLEHLAARLAPAQAARTQQRHSEQRGGRARRATGKLRVKPLFDDAARLLLTLLYQRQVCSMKVLADLLEVTATCIGDLVKQTRRVLEDHDVHPGTAQIRFARPDALLAFLDSDQRPARATIIERLSHPALTGLTRDELQALTQRLAARQSAQAEHLGYQRRGGPRQPKTRAGVREPQVPGDRLDRHPFRPMQPADLRPLLHLDHPPELGGGQDSRAHRGSFFSRRRHAHLCVPHGRSALRLFDQGGDIERYGAERERERLAVGSSLGHTICTCLVAFGHDKALLGAQPSAVAPSRVIYGSPPSTVMDVLHERHPCTSAARASVCLVDGDLHLLWGVRPQGAAFGVVGHGDLAGAQVADDLDSAGRCGSDPGRRTYKVLRWARMRSSRM